MTYAERSYQGQVAVLRPLAKQLAQDFGLQPTKIKLANHGYNTTFRIKTAQHDYALRINVSSQRSTQNVAAEIAWTSQLAESGNISVPKPIASPNGEHVLYAHSPLFTKPLAAVLYTWLPGRPFPERPSLQTYTHLARITKYLHDHPPILPSNATLPSIADSLLGNPLNFHKHGVRGHDQIFTEVREIANQALKKLAKSNPPQAIHYDLHYGNLLMNKATIHVIDFDDCIIAPPLLDVAISFFYFRRDPNGIKKEPAYWQALGSHYSDHGLTTQEFESLIAARRLLLANEILTMENAEIRAMIPVYTAGTVHKLTEFLKTGRYDGTPYKP
jgi:Ser/Thr protein kinase RdoA (MazF antagonist)